MGNKLRNYICTECGVPTRRRRQSYESKICFDCGVARAKAAAHAMVQRDGPYWEAHLRSSGGLLQRQSP